MSYHMQEYTEKNTDTCTAQRQQTHFRSGYYCQGRNILNMKRLRRNAHGSRKPGCHQRCKHTGNQCRVMHNANTDNLHGKDRCRHRCTKHRRKSSTHAAHDQKLCLLFILFQDAGNHIAEASTHLQSSPFSSCRTAEQVGNDRSNKNQHCHYARYFILSVNRIDHQIRSPVHGNLCRPIQINDNQSANRQ